MTLVSVLLVLAVFCFVFAAVGVVSRVNLIAVGLALVVIAMFLSGSPGR